jgi:hypothetical protein
MAGFLPNEGETWMATNILTNNNFELRLFTNASVGETDTYGTITQPTNSAVSPSIALNGADCVVTGDSGAWPQKTFTAPAGGYTGTIRGWFICRATSPNQIVSIEMDSNIPGGMVMLENDTYKITPIIKFA